MTLKALMILPMPGMVLLTIIISFRLIQLRYRAVLQDGVNPAYFGLNKGAKLPDYLIKTTQHYENLFESPLLFYSAILLLVALNVTDYIYVFLSWAYLTTRVAHAYIHTTHNRVSLRRNVFLISFVVLILLWIRIFIEVIKV